MYDVPDEEVPIEDGGLQSEVHANEVSHSGLEIIVTERSQNAIREVATNIAKRSKILSCVVNDGKL